MATFDLGRVTPIYKGDYSASASYELNDIVLYNGNLYWHVKATATVGILPTDTTVWKLAFADGGVRAEIRGYADDAQASAEAASASATSASTSAISAQSSATSASQSATQANTSATNASASASQAQEYAEQAEESAAALSDINERLTTLSESANNLWAYGTINDGYSINSNGNLTINAGFVSTDYIPVSFPGFIYGYGARFAFYDANKVFITGTSFVLSTNGVEIANGMHMYSVPESAAYFRICMSKTTDYPLFIAKTNGFELETYNYAHALAFGNVWDTTHIKAGYAITRYGNTTANADYDLTDFVPVSPGMIIYGYGSRFCLYDETKTFISDATYILNTEGSAMNNGMHYYVVPLGASYLRICAQKSLETNQKQLYLGSIFDNFLLSGTSALRKLYCLGDSITRGMYAEIGASSSSGPTDKGYPYWIGKENNYEVVNLGNSGSGWANKGSAETVQDESVSRNAKDVVDDNTFSDADIITLAYGVNDWKGADQNIVLGDMTSTAGDGTVIGNMKYCIEAIYSKKPTAQIIVLLPLNTNRQWSGMATMTLENNWAFGYAYRNNQTLEDYRNAIRECAEYYNVKVVDLEEICPINRLNIKSVCGDGLHPTLAFHKQMGQALAPLIH